MFSNRKKSKSSLFSKINNREEALKLVRDSANGFLFVAVLLGVFGAVFNSMSTVVEAIVWFILALILRQTNSRICAILLAIIYFFSLITTVLGNFGIIEGVGTNIILAVIMFVSGIRSVEATFKLAGRFAETPLPTNPRLHLTDTFEMVQPADFNESAMQTSTDSFDSLDFFESVPASAPSSSGYALTTTEWILIAVLIVVVLIVGGLALLLLM